MTDHSMPSPAPATQGRVGRATPGRDHRTGPRWTAVALLLVAVTAGLIGGVIAGMAAAPTLAPAPALAEPPLHPTTIHLRKDFGQLDTGKRGVKGEAILARCASCHAEHAKAPYAKTTSDLKEFHVGKAFAHGQLVCGACHDLQDRERLHLADGTPLALSEVQQLCGQCHGMQARDYAHGAHGGMNGYWDLRKGPRTRNSCVDCHNPHTPKYPSYAPVQKPRDRFLEPAAARH